MFEIVLYEPEIPPNTGNVIRLCANTGSKLTLIEPLGFELDDARLRRAGLDYHEYAEVRTAPDFGTWRERASGTRLVAFSTRNAVRLDRFAFLPGDALLFGPETRGLPDALLDTVPESQRVVLPMQPGGRSLNLANSVAVALYEAWRQHDYAGARHT